MTWKQRERALGVAFEGVLAAREYGDPEDRARADARMRHELDQATEWLDASARRWRRFQCGAIVWSLVFAVVALVLGSTMWCSILVGIAVGNIVGMRLADRRSRRPR